MMKIFCPKQAATFILNLPCNVLFQNIKTFWGMQVMFRSSADISWQMFVGQLWCIRNWQILARESRARLDRQTERIVTVMTTCLVRIDMDMTVIPWPHSWRLGTVYHMAVWRPQQVGILTGLLEALINSRSLSAKASWRAIIRSSPCVCPMPERPWLPQFPVFVSLVHTMNWLFRNASLKKLKKKS